MIGRRRHVDEERLFNSYLAQQSGERVDPRVGEHLADCAACGARYGELVRFMSGLRADADEELDAVFPPEQIRHQHQQILRRLEHVGHAARVISFPGRPAESASGVRGGQAASRWIAAAAAAGLFVGAAVGTLYNASWRPVPSQARVSRPVAPPPASAAGESAPLAQRVSQARVLDDNTFLSEMESAIDGPRCRELRTFDVLTPAVRDVRATFIAY